MPSTDLALDQPLPPQLVGSTHGWFTEYRRWPVYSRPWNRLRLRAALLCAALFFALVVMAVVFTSRDARALGGVVMMVLQIALPLTVGPWLAHRVRCAGWTTPREGRTLLAVLLAVALGTLALNHLIGEPVKQALAEATGAVDAQGKRKTYRLQIGVTVTDDEPQPTPAAGKNERPSFFSVSTVTQGLLLFWLAGGVALLAWRREVQGLQRLHEQQALEAAERQRREAEMRLSVLAAQVEPHFLFNTLAGVRAAIASDPARASGMIDHLVDYLRAAIPRLRADGTLEATVGAQAEIVRAYLALMHARIPRMRYAIHLPDALKSARCPPLMLISLAENAVKHGVEPKIGPAEVRLEVAEAKPGRLRLSLLDDGVGFADSGLGSGLGLSNIQARLAQLHGDSATLALRARPGGGVEATIELPLKHVS